jgi:hypothetical protein
VTTSEGTTPGDTRDGFSSPIRLEGLGLILREWTDDDLPVMVESIIREGTRYSLLTWQYEPAPTG